ncbi:MAG: 16S rRNA (cytosine(1402)-N(4))-methyltransferase RsmH [Gammaproteobacteria bacterium]|nr:16S rRNA (cytosine(1402)-N(4))-methyltransferase RsmH [Gammaproteobacteria bacterium]
MPETPDIKAQPEHVPVLREQALEALRIDPAGTYVDCTFGRGGHSEAILAALNANGRLVALDRDPAAVTAAAKFATDPRFAIHQRPFSELEALAVEAGIDGSVAGVLFDLGVSSPQLDDAARGFSFQADGPLDMRMDPTRGISVGDWLASASERDIADCLFHYGDERYARRIARGIVRYRSEQPLTSTAELVGIIGRAMPRKPRDIHFATRSFQALRIRINDELEELRAGLEQALAVLEPLGRLVVITFHSIEDRIVKRFMREAATGDLPPDLPIPDAEITRRLRVIGRPVRAAADEIAANPRARSATLRIAEKTV